MSIKRLVPLNLPALDTLPSSATTGDLAYKNSDGKVYVYDGDEWVIASGSGGDDFVLKTIVDAAGDLIVGSADNTVGRLALGSDGQVLTVDTSGSGVAKVKWAAASGGLTLLDTQTWTSSTTYTMPAGAKIVLVEMIGAGGGGGGGARNTGANTAGGGGGGSGAAFIWQAFDAGQFSSPVTVTVGSGGAGATGRTSGTGGGNQGSAGGVTSFGTFSCPGGRGGNAGSTTAGGANTGGYVPFGVALSDSGTVGSGGQGGINNGNQGRVGYRGGAGGGGGAGCSTTAAFTGAAGGAVRTDLADVYGTNTGWGASAGGGGSGGASGNAGNNATASSGDGGGGGGSSRTAAAGTGGNGATPGGGGGGGGGAVDNDSGAGGGGGGGQVKVWVYG